MTRDKDRGERPTPDPRWIVRSLGLSAVRGIGSVSGGWDTLLWRVETAEQSYALRVFRPEQAAGAQREVAAMEAARAGGCPVPLIHHAGTWEDRPFLLLDWCPGRTLAVTLAQQPWRAWWLGLAVGRTLARIHQVTAPEALRQEDWIAWAGPAAAPLRSKLQCLNLRIDCLLHLDYHPRNVMIHNGNVSGILDWANARAGDPRADLARTVSILHLAPKPGPAALSPLVTVILRLQEAGWRRGYAEVAGAIGWLAPFYAWAGATLLHDLTPKVGRRGIPLTQRDLARMRRWTVGWARRAGFENPLPIAD